MTLLRSTLFNIFLFGSTLLLGIPGTVVRFLFPARMLDFARFWARLEIAAARLICGIRLEVLGRENLPPGPVLIAARHESAFDILAWTVLVPAPCFVVKRELTQIPIFGPMMLLAGMISVDREAGASAMRTLLRGGDRAKAEGRQIVIFPEGTRVEPDEHPPLQPGAVALAARTGLPVVPVMTDSGQYWGRRAFRKRPGTIRIVFHPPLPGNLGREALLEAIRAVFDPAGTTASGAAALDAPTPDTAAAEAAPPSIPPPPVRPA